MTKRKKPQGKLDIKTIVKGVMEGKKRKDIAVEAGSIANSDSAKCQAVDHVIKSSKYRDETKTLVNKLDKEINRLADSISKSILIGVGYKDKVTSIEKLTKLKELLTGGVTERVDLSSKDVQKFLDNA